MRWVLMSVTVLSSCAWGAEQAVVKLGAIPTETTAWQVAVADLDADEVPDIVYAGYDGELYCMNGIEGAPGWQADLGGFPYCLTTADLDGDARPEVLATSASLHLHVFSPEGEPLWKFTCGAPLHAVAAGPMLDDNTVQVVCGGEDMNLYFLDAEGNKLKEMPVEVAPNIEAINNLAVGDVTGDDANEVCLTNGFGIVRLLDPRTGETIWNSRDYQRRFMRDLLLWDADGDGKQEVLASSERVELLEGEGMSLWQAQPGISGRGYRMAQLAPVDLEGDGQAEVAVLHGPELSVLDAGGERVYHNRCDFFYFTCLAGFPGPDNHVVVGPVVGADRNVYALEFGEGAEDEFAAFNHDHGYVNTLNENLERIREQVLAAEPDPNMPERTYYVWISGGSPPPNACDWLITRPQMFEAAYAYDNLKFVDFIQYREPGYTGQGRELPPEDLVSIARKLEEGGALHVLAVAHGLDAYMSVAMVQEWLQAAPTSCRGIMMHENSHFVNHQADADEALLQRMDAFVDEFMVPVMDVCLAQDRRFYLMEKQAWWVALPATARYADRILAEKYRSIIVPMVEESNSRCPEMNFVGRVGLWRSGIVDTWGLNVIDDQLRTCKLYEYNPCEAHPTLRHYVAYTAAGACELKLGKLGYLFEAPRGEERYGLSVGEINYRPYGLLCFDTFMHMLGKGLLAAPEPEELVGASPVAVRFHEPDEGYWLSARMRDPAEIAPESREGLFTGFDWGFTRPHDYYAPAYLMNVPRHCHQFIPENPYGLPLVVPHWTPPEQMSWAAEVLDTDGVHLLDDGRAVSAREAKPGVLAAFAAAAQGLPFTATNVYWMARRSGESTYRVVLVDPGYLTPSDREARVSVNAPHRIVSARDVLSGEELRLEGNVIEVHVPAGAFRLVDLELRTEG